jgi:hypothetical protein
MRGGVLYEIGGILVGDEAVGKGDITLCNAAIRAPI